MTNRQIVDQIMRAFAEGASSKITNFFAPNFVTHDAHTDGTKAGFLKIIDEVKALREERIKLRQAMLALTIARTIEDNNFVVVHGRIENFFEHKNYVFFDIFKFDNNLVTEHWSNSMEELPANASGHNQIDGPMEITDRANTAQNKEIVTNSYKPLMMSKDNLLNRAIYLAWPIFRPVMLQMTKKYMAADYIQHSGKIPGDTPRVVLDYYAREGRQGRFLEIKKIHHVIGEGDFVLVTAETLWANQPTAYYDLYRVANNKIAEHWEVIEPLPTGKDIINPAGKW